MSVGAASPAGAARKLSRPALVTADVAPAGLPPTTVASPSAETRMTVGGCNLT